MLAILLLSLAQDPGPIVRTGEHFEVPYALGENDLANRALEVAEATWPIAVELLGEPSANLSRPISIPLTLRGDYDPQLLGRRDLPLTNKVDLANDASRAVIEHFFANHSSHPAWFTEGLAGLIEWKALHRIRLVWTPEREPVYSTSQRVAQRVATGKRLPSYDAFLSDSLDGVSLAEASALRRWFFVELAKDENRLETLLRAAKQISGGADYPRALMGALHGIYGGPTFWKRFEQSLVALKPEWEESTGTLSLRLKRWLQLAPKRHDAVAWNAERLGDESWSLEGTFQIQSGANSAMNVLLDRSLAGYVSVSMQSDAEIVVAEYNARTAKWKRLAVGSAGYARDDVNRFRIEWNEGYLAVFADSARVLETKISRKMSGAWGLGVKANCAGSWADVRLR